ncbi:MAG: hypothetical protein K8R53_03555 [Bacteroidales bacterium]|nr:hypothetical protein [Bacteroidales bacterium]
MKKSGGILLVIYFLAGAIGGYFMAGTIRYIRTPGVFTFFDKWYFGCSLQEKNKNNHRELLKSNLLLLLPYATFTNSYHGHQNKGPVFDINAGCFTN